MKSLDSTQHVELLSAMLSDLSIVCRTSMERDLMTIRSRFEHEGPSFLTIALPTFAKSFERALELGRIDSTEFAGFKSASKAPYPAFLQGLASQVFNLEGVLRDAPNVDAIDGIRQICVCFKKVNLPCTLGREKAAEEQFIATEREVSRFRVSKYNHYRTYRTVCGYLYWDVLGNASELLANLQIIPRHGPGATANKVYGNGKFRDQQWTERLQKTFPFDYFKLFNNNELADEYLLSDKVELGYVALPRKEEPPVRVAFVPKTMKSPRVIAIEPVWTMEVQQGLMKVLVDQLESDRTVGGHINFSRQDINRNLAFESSKSRAYATIDLSEASDRVHPSLVAGMLQGFRPLSRAVFSCRSERAILPSGVEIRLKKFASQGSALCFPVEAMVFFAIVVTSILKHRNLPLERAAVKAVARECYVYGDDIIVPTAEVSFVCEQLEAAGLKVNRGKTFSRGHFRESCGMDAYNGVDVTPVYVRHPLPQTKHEADEIVGTISTANQFYRKGYWKTAAFLRDSVEKVVGVVPHVRNDSSVAGWHSFKQWTTCQRWNMDLQRFDVRGIKLRSRRVSDPLDGYRALHKWATTRTGKVPVIMADEPLSLDSFVSRVVRGKTRLTYRWVSSM